MSPVQRGSTPRAYDAYDIRHRLLQFDSQRLLHKNAPWQGTRYAIVFFNKDVNYRDDPRDKRSVKLQRAPPQPLTHLPTRRTPDVRAARHRLVTLLDRTRFPEDRTAAARPHSKYGDKRGTFLSFGVSQSRKPRATRRAQGLYTRRAMNRNNTLYGEVYKALLAYMEAFAPQTFGTHAKAKYQTCIVAKDSQCEWHRDTGNIGNGAITGLGAYTEGALWVEREGVLADIKNIE